MFRFVINIFIKFPPNKVSFPAVSAKNFPIGGKTNLNISIN